MRAIVVGRTGGPEQLTLREIDKPVPEAHEALIRIESIGVNFIDIYFREGRYPAALPFIPGQEAAGVVEAVGRDAKTVKVGDRVAYTGGLGAYAEYATVPANRLVKLPEKFAARDAAAAMLQGMTAHYLTRSTYPLAAGETALVHAAAGGVGLILCQWAKALGATVIGVVGSEAKAELAKKHGCKHVLISGQDELVPGVKKLTRDAGVAVVYDAVGKDTFMESLDCLRRRGMMVTFGNASGAPPAISPLELSKRGSLFLTRPTLFHYIATRAELEAAARELFAAVRAKKVRIVIGQKYPLARAADAHRDLEGRRTTGSAVLVP